MLPVETMWFERLGRVVARLECACIMGKKMIVERHYGDLPLLCGLILDDMSPYFSGSKLVVGDLSEGVIKFSSSFEVMTESGIQSSNNSF